MNVFEKDIKDYLRTAGVAFVPGIIFSIILSALTTFFAGVAGWLSMIIYAILLIWAVPKLPKAMDTFFEILIITFLLSAFAGIIGMILPTAVTYLGWISIVSLTTWFNMLVIAVLTLSILNKHTNWL